MEETQNQSNQETTDQGSSVSFPTVGEPKKSSGAKTVLIVGILVLVAILGFVIYKSASKKTVDDSATPSSFDNLTTPSDQVVQTFTPAPSPTPATVKVDKAKIQVQIQNGTGITGEAAYLQTQLASLGYTNVKVGNSSSTATSTSVTFSSSLDSAVVSDITQKLNSIYQTVVTNTSSTSTFDVVVVTGLRKGATPKPSSSATPSSSIKPSATPSSSIKPSATPSAKPSPTATP